MSERKASRKRRPATTDEGREHQLISLAADLAEKQLINGTASSQVITHFLKLASTREALEQQKIQRENLLLSAKVDQIASSTRMEELYAKAIGAMREYSGNTQDVDSDDDDYE